MDEFYEAEKLESEDTLLFRYTPVDGQDGLVPLLVEISFPDPAALPDCSFRSIQDADGNEFSIWNDVSETEYQSILLLDEDIAIQIHVTAETSQTYKGGQGRGWLGDFGSNLASSTASIFTFGMSDNITLIGEVTDMLDYMLSASEQYVYEIEMINTCILQRQKKDKTKLALYPNEVEAFYAAKNNLSQLFDDFYKEMMQQIKDYQKYAAFTTGLNNILTGAGAGKITENFGSEAGESG